MDTKKQAALAAVENKKELLTLNTQLSTARYIL